MSKIPVFDCRCQNCNFTFKINKILINSVNLDYSNQTCDKFFSLNLNEVLCPSCNSTFTYEIPMIIMSFKNKFAIKVTPSLYNSIPKNIFPPPFRLLPDGFRFREVAYLIEAVEKAKIFIDGEDDIYIEYFKFKNFSDEDTMPFDEINLVYSHSDDDRLYFNKYNCDNKLIDKYSKTKTKFNKNISIKSKNDIWNIINRITINTHEKG